jgi:predicted MFS family arabinose efflux permease
MVAGGVSDTSTRPDLPRGDFRRFWVAGAADQLGSHATAVALPLLVLSAGAGPLAAGALGTCAAGAQTLWMPMAGVLADRYPRRSMMVLAALVAACSAGAVTALIALDRVQLPLIAVATMTQGLAAATYCAAAAGAARAILPAQDPERALAALRARDQAVQLAGPGFGGALFGLGRWVPFLADSISCLVAAICVRSVRSELRPQAIAGQQGEEGPQGGDTPPRTFRRDLREGVAFLLGQPFLRFVALWSAGINLVFGALYYHVVLQSRVHGASSASIGLVLTIAGCGGVLGALLVPWLLSRVRASVIVLGASWGTVLLSVALALTTSTVAYGVLLSSLFLVSPALSVIFQTGAVLRTPDGLQGRVGTALTTVGEGTAALAPLAAGLLVEHCDGPRTAVLVGVLTAGLAFCSTRHLRTLGPDGPTGRP